MISYVQKGRHMSTSSTLRKTSLRWVSHFVSGCRARVPFVVAVYEVFIGDCAGSEGGEM